MFGSNKVSGIVSTGKELKRITSQYGTGKFLVLHSVSGQVRFGEAKSLKKWPEVGDMQISANSYGFGGGSIITDIKPVRDIANAIEDCVLVNIREWVRTFKNSEGKMTIGLDLSLVVSGRDIYDLTSHIPIIAD